MENILPADIDDIFKKNLSLAPQSESSNSSAWGNAPGLVSDQIESICKRMEELANADKAAVEQAPEETLKKLSDIYGELIAVAKKVRSLETTSENVRSEHDLQMDLEREAQRRRQF